MISRLASWRRGAFRTLLWILTIFCGIGGLSITPRDRARLREFARAVERWQINPDFRQVQAQYATLGAQAMQVRPLGFSARACVMRFRKTPGLPKYLAVGESSSDHYIQFARGPLSAYLRLSREQGVPETADIVQSLAAKPNPSDAELRAFLHSFKIPVPVADDVGAIESLRRMLRDIGPGDLKVRARIEQPLQPLIEDLAREVRLPVHLDDMTPNQQQTVLALLDPYVAVHDHELWRTKQLSDFLAGIWAQTYGQIYCTGIRCVLWLQLILLLLFIPLLALMLTRRRRVYCSPRRGEAG